VVVLLSLINEKGDIFKATTTRQPNLNSSSKWYSDVKFINNEAIIFYYVKGNGSYYYFQYTNKWYRLLKFSINTENIATQYTTSFDA
jgi:hypothetical protein